MRKYTTLFILTLMFVSSAFLGGCKTTEPGVTPPFSFDSEGNTVLQPPPAGEGFQVQIPAFDVPAGKEIQRDYYITLPNDEDYEVGKIEIAMNDGTHHMNFFRTKLSDISIDPSHKTVGQMRSINNGKDSTQNCYYYDQSFTASSIFSESDILIEAQLAGALYSWDLPKLPDGRQAIIHLKPHEPMILQFHYVNAVTQKTANDKGKISVNVWKNKNTSGGTVTASMLFARKMILLIPAARPDHDTTVTYSKNCKFLALIGKFPIYLLGMTGHFHSRGFSFIVDKVKDSAGVQVAIQEKIYVSNDWGEPPFTTFVNPIKLDAGEYIRYTCVYKNASANSYTWGPNVETNEHMNLFAWFAPGWNNGATVYDSTP